MQVKLRVIGGKNDGREIKISVPEFIIGRGDNAHLKPSSDLVSRHHCSLFIKNGALTIKDMDSRNGTFVNGEQIKNEYVAKVGDTLRVGRLQFEILIDHMQPGNKKPKVQGVAEAAARTAASGGGTEQLDDESITDWLAPMADDSTKSLTDTQQFSLEETPTKMFVRSDELADSDVRAPASGEAASDPGSKKHKKYKKLPPQQKAKADSSKSAADDVLRKFFNRR
ncbi:MAG: FHA domain-containing protein [Pirellulaceae bacterium]